MYVTSFAAEDRASDAARCNAIAAHKPAWVLLYGVEDSPLEELSAKLSARLPGVPVLGCTSFQGVFTPRGFTRDPAVLVGEVDDDVEVAAVLRPVPPVVAEAQSRAACQEIERQLGGRPDTLLLHATPGFEERILAGVRMAWGEEVPVYGGTAADDTLSGRWAVLLGNRMAREGFLMAGFRAPRRLVGSFLGGYLPTGRSGVITAAKERVIKTIDGSAAAEVYNSWTDGAISEEVDGGGGNVLFKTNLMPLARVVEQSHGMPRRVLSHPQEVLGGSRALKLFTNFEAGQEVTLMTSTREPLVQRVRRVVQRAHVASPHKPRAGLMVYCAGCLGILLDQADRIGQEFSEEIGDVPFIGIATFGEQGTFFGKSQAWHGNLMCSAVFF